MKMLNWNDGMIGPKKKYPEPKPNPDKEIG